MNAVNIDMLTFLKNIVNRTTIDYMIIDNGGAEYQLLPMIAIENVLEDNGIVICQMNVEIYAPGPLDRLEQFAEIMLAILKAKRFAPIHSLYWGHLRTFFINIDHPFCVEKYLVQFFEEQST
ncbi:unnamed protein product [Strongylus vulgaris]|uniref:Methyltransferase FkbM domain-containing protein n=1 Tax=Strongylus vulgaris TaxID=40348 RepID=A0A3P7I742_STRVU|nr:unnamed protein product [Strongylus vulgaris]